MTVDLAHLLHNMAAGGVAAAGFGVLFNIGFRTLPACFGAGALALAIRTIGTDSGFNLEISSFVAAFAVGLTAATLSLRAGIARSSLAVSGVIPMIPGSFATKAIVALIPLTMPDPNAQQVLDAMVYLIRVTLIFGALGAGVAIPFQILGDKGH
jgi:uncharacterized membrane protein YjjB (DUF3815 family)